MFKAWLVERKGEPARLVDLDPAQLPAGDVDVRVLFSTLNYKDGLAITARSPVVRAFPMVPGIDLAGTVESSRVPEFAPGDTVVITGAGLGETVFGGLAQRARVGSAALLRVPPPFDARRAAAIGTAGFTAMQCVLRLEQHGLRPGEGEILVTGAAGGVGSVAIAVLARLGYTVVASTGRVAESGYLRALGASRIVDRAQLSGPGKPLGPERWAGVIDTVGSTTLANACSEVRIGGAVSACGLAAGMDFPSTVAPFILRGVTLYGIDSLHVSRAARAEVWTRLARDLDPERLDAMTREIWLGDVEATAAELLAGRVRGRLVVDVNR